MKRHEARSIKGTAATRAPCVWERVHVTAWAYGQVHCQQRQAMGEGMKVGSLFSGIGGLDLGLERAGMEITWQVENDPFCRRVLAKHWPDVPCYGDIRELSGANLEPVDLICGGFPCQPTSHAGRRRGEDDDRWLWPEMLRLIRETRPAYVVGENVFGLVTHNKGLLLASVVADLEAEGYEVAAPVVFPACAIGALHRRDRVWVLAYARHHDRRTEQGQQQEERAEVAYRLRTADTHTLGVGLPRPEPRAYHGSEDSRQDEGQERQRLRLDAWQLLDDGGRRLGVCEPDVERVVNGLPSELERSRSIALGNAVVPQAAELIGRHIMAVLA